MENTLIKMVIYNYITNYKSEKDYNSIKDRITKYIDKHPELKKESNISNYLVTAKKHISTIERTVGSINIDLEKYDRLMKEMDDISSDVGNLTAGSIDDFLKDIMDIKKRSSKTDDLYFVVDKNKKLNKKLDMLRENMYCELEMNSL